MGYIIHLNGARIECETAEDVIALSKISTDPCSKAGVKKTLRLPPGARHARSVPIRRGGRTLSVLIGEVMDSARGPLAIADIEKGIKRLDPEFKNLSRKSLTSSLHRLNRSEDSAVIKVGYNEWAAR